MPKEFGVKRRRALHDRRPAAEPTATRTTTAETPDRAPSLRALQATAGNRAAARLLAARRGTPEGGDSPRASDTPIASRLSTAEAALQRRIGFEIETGIPVKKKRTLGDGTVEYQDPDYQDIDTKLLNNSVLDVDSNPVGGGKILEFASAAVDDTAPVDQFAATAATWIAKLSELRTAALQTPPHKRLYKRVPGAPKRIRYGVRTGAPGNMDRASVQMTHGLQLEQVREFFTNLALRNNQGASRVTKKEEAAHESVPAVTPILTELAKIANPRDLGATDAEVEQVAGYLTLVAQSMVAGRKVESGYIKNRSFLFYKSKLSDVRNHLVAHNTYAAAVLDNDRGLNLIGFGLMIATKRKFDEMLFVGTGGPAVGAWLNDILSGTDDPAFEAAKNPWGTDIAPENVDGKFAAVVEHRDIDKVVPPAGALKMSDPAALLEYLKAIYIANQNWQDLGPDAESDSDSESSSGD